MEGPRYSWGMALISTGPTRNGRGFLAGPAACDWLNIMADQDRHNT